jgi:uncharacterized membrane protein YfcA
VTIVLLLLAALVAGAANALAGGGTFITFPAMLFAGIASVKANATACLVMVPGGIVSAWVYRGTIVEQPRALVLQLVAVSLAGSAAGSVLLLHTANTTFSSLVPWLLLVASAVFSAAPTVNKKLRGIAGKAGGTKSVPLLLVGQCCISIYGGYFGAGMGVLMIALFLAVSSMDAQSASGVRLVCATSVNLLAVVIFAVKGAIVWNPGVPMLIAGIAGGYVGARVMRRLSERAVRTAILAYAWGLTAYFFIAR